MSLSLNNLKENQHGLYVHSALQPEDQIYFDYQSTTPCDPRVVEVMLPYFSKYYGNPHSRTHAHGWRSEEDVDLARATIASLIGAKPREVIFTSGATESNNLAIKGVAHFYKQSKNHIITCVTEHKCVLESCRQLEQEGFEVTYLPVLPNGLVDLNHLKEVFKKTTSLVSIMTVNNEIGVIQPIQEIGDLCRERGVFFHTDAAQAAGKIPLDVVAMHVDLMSLSAHKMYGPKGIGALYIGKSPRVRLTPLISGGGQERGFRSGTLAPHLCVGFAHAARLSQDEMIDEVKRISYLSTYLLEGIERQLDHVYLNGDRQQRIPGNLNISFAYVEGEGLIMAIKQLAVSSGSACTSSSLESSYVLKALGVSEDLAHTSLRLGIGRFTKKEDIDIALESIVEAVTKLRNLSPLWEMVQEGINLSDIRWSGH